MNSQPDQYAFTLVPNSSLDRDPGEGVAYPKIVRNFRPEVSGESIEFRSQTDVHSPRPPSVSRNSADLKRTKRTVSFSQEARINAGEDDWSGQIRQTYDGREIAVVSLDTQTDWDWLEEAVLEENVKIIKPSEKKDSTDNVPQSKEKKAPVKQTEVESPLPYPYANDEYGIPILDLSSDTDDYNRESERQDLGVDDPELGIILDQTDFPLDEHGRVQGMFSGECEFCEAEIKPFPTAEQQQRCPPEELYCCEEYRHFVEVTVLADEKPSPAGKLINVKPHSHFGSKQARKMAKEKAQQRMREREMVRLHQQQHGTSGHGKDGTGYQSGSQRSAKTGYTSSGAHDGVMGRTVTSYKEMVARQMKTINYQLSSQKCLEEGWTVRPPSPMFLDDGDDVFIPEPLDPAFLAKGKSRGRGLIQKFYEDGQPFLTIFPDGTGNVYYASGAIAVLIVSKEPGHYIYLVQEDSVDQPEVLAIFRSNGQASCCYMNGQLRLFLDQYGGIELDTDGGKKKKWLWKDNETHIHAPPFQPVCIGLTANIAIRVMTQENISLTFRCKSRSCRFPVGAKLKLVAPENIPAKEIDENQLFIQENKAYVESVLNKVSNLLRFPKSPKLEKMLPPLHITSKIQKNEKMRQEQGAAQAAIKAQKQSRQTRPIVVVK